MSEAPGFLSAQRKAEIRRACDGTPSTLLPPKSNLTLHPREVVALLDELETLQGMLNISAELTIKALDHG